MLYEILSPAGSPEHAKAACMGGADAVYIGMKKFSARANAANFDEAQLKEIVDYCHARKVKIYAAVNVMFFDSEIYELADLLKTLCNAGVDALITQDLAVIELVKLLCPDMELHASTQMTIHTSLGCEFAKQLGFKRAVLSRELPFEIIDELSSKDIETEVFVHGALCMSVSGQCLMSAAIGGRSANRGMCAQPCRLPCSPSKAKASNEHALSLKDMSILDELPKLEEAGVDSFKIEGRMKRPEYAAFSAKCACLAAKGEPYDKKMLENVFSRSGFTDGYFYSKRNAEMFGMRTAEDAKTAADSLPQIHNIIRQEPKRALLSFDVKIKKDSPIKICAEDENGISARFVGDIPEAARNRACDKELLTRQLSKLGDTFYELDKIECDIDDPLAVSASALNSARRELCDEITRKRAEHFTRRIEFFEKDLPKIKRRSIKNNFKLRIRAENARQLEKAVSESIELAFLPLDIGELEKGAETVGADKLGTAMPRFTFDEKREIMTLEKAYDMGIRHILCTNFAHLVMAKRMGFTAHAGAGLNTANTYALDMLEKLGAADAVVSNEMKISQINALGGKLPIGVTAYGRLALMLCANCPAKPCKKGGCGLYDRTGRYFPIACRKKFGYVELLNCDVLSLSDKTNEIKNADFLQIEFFEESAERVLEIIHMFEKGIPLENATRGLYYRGLKKL